MIKLLIANRLQETDPESVGREAIRYLAVAAAELAAAAALTWVAVSWLS